MVPKTGKRFEKVSFMWFFQSIYFYFKLYGFKGGLSFAIGLLQCRTELIYSVELGKQEKHSARLINPQLDVKLIESTEGFDLIQPDYVAATGSWLARRDYQLIASEKEYLAVVYKEGQFAGWGWVRKGPVKYGSCEIGRRDCVIHKCRTLRNHRRQGVYSTLIMSLQDMLADRGFQRAYIGAKSFNKLSLRGIERAGFGFVEECDLGSFASRLLHHLKGKGPKVMGVEK
jgi:GNAT superfamily N-acetyltransferase